MSPDSQFKRRVGYNHHYPNRKVPPFIILAYVVPPSKFGITGEKFIISQNEVPLRRNHHGQIQERCG